MSLAAGSISVSLHWKTIHQLDISNGALQMPIPGPTVSGIYAGVTELALCQGGKAALSFFLFSACSLTLAGPHTEQAICRFPLVLVKNKPSVS